jgi:hypothetical protein
MRGSELATAITARYDKLAREVLDPRAGRWSTETLHNVNTGDSEVVESG